MQDKKGVVDAISPQEKYIPLQKILIGCDKNKKKWNSYITRVHTLFKTQSLPDMKSYDETRYLKMERKYFRYSDCVDLNKLSFEVKNTEFMLSDHKPVKSNGIFTWNILHHYSYNGSNDYLDTRIVKHFDYKILTEHVRYSLIATRIIDELESGDCYCFSLQECEFSIYKTIVKYLKKYDYTCRFIPHKVSYDNSGLYVESYGCALILKGEDLRGTTYVNPIEKVSINRYDTGFKYIIHIHNNTMYSSVHLPKCGRYDDYSAWVRYTYNDLEFILSKLSGNVIEGYIIGDMNMERCVLDSFVLVFPEYEFDVLGEIGVDYIIHVKKKFQFQPSSSLSYDLI